MHVLQMWRLNIWVYACSLHLQYCRFAYPAGIWCENDLVLTSMRRDYVASTLIVRHFGTKCPLGKVCVDFDIQLKKYYLRNEFLFSGVYPGVNYIGG